MADLKPCQKEKYCHRGNVKHGLFHDNQKLFNLWQTMKSRCGNPNREKYKDYGGRGIRVCDEWKEASNFVLWALENGYKDGLQLDRIDNNGDYGTKNCRFVTPKENSRNRRNTKFLVVNNEKRCVSEWSEITGVSAYTIYRWIKKKGIEYAEKRLSEIAQLSVLRR